MSLPAVAPVSILALGTALDLHLNGAHAARIRETLEHLWVLCARGPDDPAQVTMQVETDGATDEAGTAALLVDITQRITKKLIATQVGRLVMLHAAALSDPATGATLVAIAPGGTGKTTLCRMLGQELDYITDETVGIEEGGLILPYPKPLSVRRPQEFIKDEVAPSDLGMRAHQGEARPAAFVLLDRSHGKPMPELEPLSLGDALASVVSESSSLWALDRGLHRLADLFDTTGTVHRLHYSEAPAVAPLVRELLGMSA